MSDKEQTDHFAAELDRLVDRFRAEYELSYATVIGTLTLKATFLALEAREADDDS